MNGFTQGGYKLVYTDTPTEWLSKELEKMGYADFSTSLGFSMGSRHGQGPAGMISNVWWDSPAFKAGVTPNMELISVNGTAYNPKVLTDAILAAEKDKKPLQLQFRDGKQYKTIASALLRWHALSFAAARGRNSGPARRNICAQQKPATGNVTNQIGRDQVCF